MWNQLAGHLPQIVRRSVQSCLLTNHRYIFKSALSKKAAEVVGQKKTEYEKHLEKFRELEKHNYVHPEFVKNSPYRDEFLQKMYHFALCFIISGFAIPLLLYSPDWLNKEWGNREAHLVLEERLAAGMRPIDHNYAPPELIADMVPEAGDWEEDWLDDQPAVRSKWVTDYRYVTIV